MILYLEKKNFLIKFLCYIIFFFNGFVIMKDFSKFEKKLKFLFKVVFDVFMGLDFC